MNLALVTLEELIEEIQARYDACIIAGQRMENGQLIEENEWCGGAVLCQGLASEAICSISRETQDV